MDGNDFQGVTFQNLWGLSKSEYSEEIRQIWLKYNLIPSVDRADERLNQVLYVVQNKDNNIIGISTVYPVYVKPLRNHFFTYRCMLVPGHGVQGLLTALTLESFKFLESVYEEETPRCIGIIAEIENKKIEKRHREAVYPKTKLTLIGYSKKGNEIRVYYFKGVKI